jgi:hypothetical protein
MRRLALVVPVLLTLLVLAPRAQAASGNPFAGKQLFMDCSSGHIAGNRPYSTWWNVYTHKGTQRTLLKKLAEVPSAKWFAGVDSTKDLGRQLERFFAGVDHPLYGGANCSSPLQYRSWTTGPTSALARNKYVGSYPVIVVRAMKHDSCKRWSGGPWNTTGTHGKYRTWFRAFVHGMARTYVGPLPYRFMSSGPFGHYRRYTARSAAVILEPDALGLMGKNSNCLSRSARARVFANLRYAVKRLHALPNVATYIDAGSSRWLSKGQAVSFLKKAGVGSARGFALNSTHFFKTGQERPYGNKIAKALHTHYVINTAENGRGATGAKGTQAATCNPPGAGLGSTPTAKTGSPYADALLWISRPGISSNKGNRCGRGPTQNVFWVAHALSLASKAVFKAAPWPPPAL